MESNMTLQTNLIAAEMAVKYAHDNLRGRSSNRSEDLVHTHQHNLRKQFGNNPWARDALRDEMSNRQELLRNSELISRGRVSAMEDARKTREAQGKRLNAYAIIKDRIGNCFEHSVLACKYLNVRYPGITSYIAETDDNTDHVFVLIDVTARGVDGRTVYVSRRSPSVLLGANAVVCDPWYHEWFGVEQDWSRKMWRTIFNVTTRYPPHPNPVPLKLISSAHVT
jgi:hypothetical protein